jgi:hypothetical protein
MAPIWRESQLVWTPKKTQSAHNLENQNASLGLRHAQLKDSICFISLQIGS